MRRASLVIIIAALTAGGLIVVYSQSSPSRQSGEGLPTGNLTNATILPSMLVGSNGVITFANASNATNNPNDSAYGQVAAIQNNVYLIWQESVEDGSGIGNYDIFFRRSPDSGGTSETSPTINLSNNPGFSEHPQIAAFGSNVYATWPDNTSGNREVLFVRSTNNGTTFDAVINLSKSSTDSYSAEIAAFGDNVYTLWVEKDGQGNASIMLVSSSDAGATFGRVLEISSEASVESLPKVAAYENDVFVVWNIVGESVGEGLYFATSSDRGASFGNITLLSGELAGESQIAAHNKDVYIVSGGLASSSESSGLFLTTSADGGKTFAQPSQLDANGTIVNPRNVELVLANNTVYVAAQISVSGSDEILLIQVLDGNLNGIANLSRNPGISECPSIVMSKGILHVVWQDLTPGNNEILYTKGSTLA